jgi:PAS domain S-box-containing protein
MKPPKIAIPHLLFVSLLIVLTVVSFISYERINALNEASNLVNHTNLVKLKLSQVLINLINAETGQRGYLLTSDSSFLEPFTGTLEKLNQSIDNIDSLTADNPKQQQNIKLLRSLIHSRFGLLTQNLDLYGKLGYSTTALKPYLEKGKNTMKEIRALIAAMMDIENTLLEKRIQQKNRTAYITPVYSLMLSIIAILIVTITYFRLRNEIHLRIRAEDNEARVQLQQQATKESEMLFRNIADTAPVLIWLSGTDKLYYFFNKGWLAFTGRSLNQEAGNGWAGGIYPGDFEKRLDLYVRAFDAREEFYMEYRLKRHDGEYRWVSDRGVPRYSPDGTFLGYAGGCMDIHEQKNFSQELEKKVFARTSELKQLNEELQVKNNIFAHAEEISLTGSYSWNLQTGELEYSDNLFRLLDCEPQEFVPSFEKFLSFIHPEDQEQVIKDGKETYETKKLVEHIYRVITKQGALKYFRSSGTFIGQEEHKFLVGTVQDVTKDTLLNEMLTSKNLMLERNNAELASFSYIASHDLQEPLRKIQSFSRLILTKEAAQFTDTAKDYFSRIISAAQRMQNLIDALLSYSGANTAEIQVVATDLNLVLEEVKTNLHEVIEEKKAVIEAAELPTLQVIQLQFYQLFSNLIFNAVKYSKPGVPSHIKITAFIVPGEEIKTGATEQKGKYWKISIADNGIGFDPQYSQKIFELFQRLHGRTEYEGTGIGLAICKKIMNNHNGFITATGQPGIGATFNIYLPVLN